MALPHFDLASFVFRDPQDRQALQAEMVQMDKRCQLIISNNGVWQCSDLLKLR